jgi:dienelactone hydrolase
VSRLGIAAGAATCLLLLAACGSGNQRPATTSAAPASPFAYDASRPLAIRDAGRVNASYPVAIHDVSYTSGGRRISAFLAVPPASGRRAAVVYVHGSGGDRRELLVPAVWLAGRGAVALTITAPSANETMPSGLSAVGRLRWQRDVTAQDVIAVRRAVDLLTARRDVDPSRIGYVGWSAGAKTGALVAGAEARLRAIVLMSGGATPLADYAAQAPKSLRDDVTRILGPVDPLRLIARARPGSLLLEDGTKDTVVPHDALVALAEAAPAKTTVRWFQTGHALGPAAYRVQLAWLAEKLRIGPAVPRALKGP